MSKTKLFGKDLSEYDEVDIDAILEQLSPEELDLLASDVDPDVSTLLLILAYKNFNTLESK